MPSVWWGKDRELTGGGRASLSAAWFVLIQGTREVRHEGSNYAGLSMNAGKIRISLRHRCVN